MNKLFFCVATSLCLAACGGEDDNGLDWANLDSAAKGAYMGTDVLPRMTTVFQGFDAQKYASVTCDTCHGPNGASSGYVMPNPNLPALPADLAPVFTNNATVANFMSSQVVPEMATLLELEPVDSTGQGEFGCFNCHTMQ